MAKGIYRRGKVYWIRYAGLDGKVVYESSHSEKFREAEALFIKRKQTIKEGKQPEPVKKIAHHLFKELATEYLKWCERQRSYEAKCHFVKQLLGAFSDIPLRQFNTRLLEQYQSDRLARGNKPATINRHIATVKHAFTKAFQWEMVEDYTCKKVKQVKLLEENNSRLRFLSREECHTLIQACDPHLKPMVIMALNTGMRKGEILNLQWDNVDLRHGFILLSRTKNGERKEIPINATLRATLEALPRRLDGGHIFFDPRTDKPYGKVYKSFYSACRRAKIRDLRFHDLRHTFASHLVMAGVDIMTVKELLGHKTLAMTLRYAHLAPAHKVKAVDILDSVLNETIKENVSSQIA